MLKEVFEQFWKQKKMEIKEFAIENTKTFLMELSGIVIAFSAMIALSIIGAYGFMLIHNYFSDSDFWIYPIWYDQDYKGQEWFIQATKEFYISYIAAYMSGSYVVLFFVILIAHNFIEWIVSNWRKAKRIVMERQGQ